MFAPKKLVAMTFEVTHVCLIMVARAQNGSHCVKAVVIWNVTLYSLVGGYHCFKETFCLHLQG
jgi:hypothetical protein